jgi:thioredoxin-like negative regulator of GroEL
MFPVFWLALAGTSAPAVAHVLPFIENDLSRAMTEARSRKLPVVVDVWAPWCHTCRFMRATVLEDNALKKQARRFVWLAINTELAKNADFMARYPITSWPTFLMLDPQSGDAVLKWEGSAKVDQFERLLDDGMAALHPSQGGSADALLAKADRQSGAGDRLEAAKSYRAALTAGGAPWLHRSRAVESLVGAQMAARAHVACAKSAAELAPPMPRGPSFANVVTMGLACALELPKNSAGGPEAVATLEPLGREAIGITGLLADDRSSLYEQLIAADEWRGETDNVRKLAEAWLTFLEHEAGRAATPEARAAFDAHRVNAALKLGQPARVLSALAQSERDLPGDYNPAARQALVYAALERYPDAIAASRRALDKAWGPRRLRVMSVLAGIYQKQGDPISAKKTLDEALKYGESLPKPQQAAAVLAKLRTDRAALDSKFSNDPGALPAAPR